MMKKTKKFNAGDKVVLLEYNNNIGIILNFEKIGPDNGYWVDIYGDDDVIFFPETELDYTIEQKRELKLKELLDG